MASHSEPGFYNYPQPKATEIPYKSPPKDSNPIVRGLPLVIAASLVANLSPVSTFLYNNAGFDSLRGLKKELDNIECRFDPTVIPIKHGEDFAPSYTVEALLRDPPEAANRFYSVKDYHEAYKSGKFTPTDVANALLPLIRRDVSKRSSHSTAFLTTRVDLVLKAAEESTNRYAAGKSIGVLDGVPVAIKDEVDVKGYKNCWGTKKDFTSPLDETSWCVLKWEEHGAINMGKTNMHEIGMDTTNNNPVTGTPLNPYNEKYYTGGSSGGSGYAVGAGLVPIALGCDGGGSIRIPSSYCGIYGLKTSHNRVSPRPTPSIAGTNTVVGPMAADMASLEVAYRVMATPDPLETSSALYPAPRPSTGLRPKVLGVYKNWMDRADAPVKALCESAIAYYVKLGYELIDIHIPLINEGQTAHALTILSEAVNGFPDTSFLSPATRILLSVGGKCPASDFLQAQRVRQLLMQHLASLFQQYPGLMILTPTTPTVGWPIKSPSDLKHGITDGNMSVRSMEYVWLANFTGCPCLQIPVGYAKPSKGTGDVPIGMMAMGEWGSEDSLIEWGFEGEKYLNEVVEGGRARSAAWFDVLGEAGKAKTGPVETNGKVDGAETNGKVAEAEPEKTVTSESNGVAADEDAAKSPTDAAAAPATATV